MWQTRRPPAWALAVAIGLGIANGSSVALADPTPTKATRALRLLVEQKLAAENTAIVACVFSKLPPAFGRAQAELAVEITADAVQVKQPKDASSLEQVVARCAGKVLQALDRSQLAPGEVKVVVAVKRPVVKSSERHDGRQGAICRFGERRFGGGPPGFGDAGICRSDGRCNLSRVSSKKLQRMQFIVNPCG